MLLSNAGPLGAQRAAGAVPPPGEETPLHALALSNLQFGTVLQGVPNTVLPSETRAGVFQVRGPAGATVRVELLLPEALRRLDTPLRVSFGPGEASAGHGRGPNEQFVFFNPHTPLTGSLSPVGHLFIRLGGTALPGLPQLGGEYRASITLTVYDLSI